MGRMSGQIAIDRAPEQVFDAAVDEPSWNPAMKSARWLTPPPIGLGSRYSTDMNGRLPMTVELVEFERPHRIGSRTEMFFMTTEGAVTIAPYSEGSLLSWDWHYDLQGYARLLTPLFAVLGPWGERRNWERLRDLLEQRTTSP